jgi:hypothetical protein
LIPPPCPITNRFSPFCANKKPPGEINPRHRLRPRHGPARRQSRRAVSTRCWAATAKPICAAANKLKALTEKFGERGFDYAGNSSADLAVWRGAREAIVVNASAAILKRAAECTRLGPTFTQDYSPFATLKSFLNELLIRSGYLLAIGAGLLLTAAFPKISIAGCAWIAPALMIAAAYGKRGGDAFRVGYVAGLAHFLSSLYWLLLIPVTGYPILGWIALGAYVALYPAIWVWLLQIPGGNGNSESWAGARSGRLRARPPGWRWK